MTLPTSLAGYLFMERPTPRQFETKTSGGTLSLQLLDIVQTSDGCGILAVNVLANGLRKPMSWLEVVARSKRRNCPHAYEYQKVVHQVREGN